MNAATETEIDLNKNPKFILCLSWAIALAWMSVLPHNTFSVVSSRVSHAFSWGHVIGYGVLSFLLCPYLQTSAKFFKCQANLKNSIIIALAITFFWGVLTEMLQFASYDRHPNIIDIGLDCFGAFIGVTVYSVISSRFVDAGSNQELSLN